MSNLKICLVTSEFPPVIGGIASHVYELARALVAEGVTVTIVHPVAPRTGSDTVQLKGATVLRPEIIRSKPFYDWALKAYLRRLHAQHQFDIIHVHGVRPLAATRGLGIATVFTNHSSGFLARHHANFLRRFRTRRLLAHVDSLIGPSDELVESARFFGYVGPARMIANGVDDQRFTQGASDKRSEWSLSDDDVVILLARRLVVKNGVVWFARAIGAMASHHARFVIAGDGPDRAEMVSILKDAKRLDNCIFLGKISNSDMPAIYRAADMAVLPSLAEATSIAGLEAMASGLPLIGTDVGGIPAIIDNGKTGLLVPPRDPEALALAMDGLVKDAQLRQAMGQAARARVEAEFSWPMIARQTYDVYVACLNQRESQ